ncbi:putative NEMP family protein [Helianthus annuus]|nr:putative NEMP family protein [Helianthus annuus]KAJ0729123.1 putative NEMP family protein [Helianthus annuus]
MSPTTNILTPAFTFLLLCVVYALLWISLCFNHTLPPLGIDVGNSIVDDVDLAFCLYLVLLLINLMSISKLKCIDVGNPVKDVTPRPFNSLHEGSKDVLSCERVPISGVSRLKLQHYASVYNVTLTPSVSIPKKWHSRIQVCFHRNSSLGLCQCENDDWRSLHNGLWVSTMSPYDQKFVDVKFGGTVTGSVTVSLEEVEQRWRYVLLVVGVVLLFFAPVVSEWVPFYYASSMVIGIITVVLIILYQARILLPTGRRNTFYLTIMCSVIGAGSFVVHHLSAFLNSFLLNFGMSPEIQNLVCYFVGLGIFLLGAALGYWLLRKFFISEDGEVYVGVAQFVKWAMFIVAVTCIFLSSKDNPLAMVAVGSCLALYHITAKIKWCYYETRSYSGNQNLWARSKHTTPNHGHAEFLSCSKKTSPLNGLINSFKWSNSPVRGKLSPLTKPGSTRDVYSTYHKTPNRKNFSKEEWEEFTEESTRQSVAELASSPEFADWVVKNSGRIKLLREDSLDSLEENESSSSNGYVPQNRNGLGFFDWFLR